MTLHVDLATFRSRHQAALEADQARHNLILGLLATVEKDPARALLWSLGPGARCALQTEGRNILLGDLTAEECEAFAAEIGGRQFPGIVGPEDAPSLLAAALGGRGIGLKLAMPQRILILSEAPIFPSAPGRGRPARLADLDLYAEWLIQFCIDALVPEGPPRKEDILARGIERPVYFWELDGCPVSMAARTRDTRDGTNISFVYTPPELRGKGYAGSVTAHACREIFAAGKQIAFLYTDARNPYSNRAYENIGFRFHCEASHWVRQP